MPTRPPATEFRTRLLAGERLIGSFIKTPAPQPIEILGDLGFDFVVIDEEHGPFDRGAIDIGLLAARASGTAGIVRVAEPSAANILAMLDMGATGVLVPHVLSVAKAREVASACRYRGGRRGFSNTTRAGRYGALGMWSHVDAADAQTVVIAMIEDREALDEIDAIAAVEGIDAFFIGRGDLAVAYGAPGMEAPEVRGAAERILAAARSAAKPVCIMVSGREEADAFAALGASAFIVASDQGFMRQAAAKLIEDMAAMA
ncbi:2-keto-3-deoxy-L-rhamnonate aldolase RhmA [Tepidamorphus gemmatus]|uniref:2-keto-3-deoxy-L-rhamnonate aldolase RhmA n=1 Tax=Tepidamorphus gemmatus TaxID=747076 RepID=A0A4R3MIC0_9HYPH|nr:aldolase/citrate lyase family protein [Tepidamorphus gemmatus]TCT13611.1 2-keto-3-deoxy-L-rhamnonate aldolase RhmA [Tepidamorphus gemmatus]